MPRCTGVEVSRCCGAHVPRCRGANVSRWCQGAEVLRRKKVPRCRGAEVPRCREYRNFRAVLARARVQEVLRRARQRQSTGIPEPCSSAPKYRNANTAFASANVQEFRAVLASARVQEALRRARQRQSAGIPELCSPAPKCRNANTAFASARVQEFPSRARQRQSTGMSASSLEPGMAVVRTRWAASSDRGLAVVRTVGCLH